MKYVLVSLLICIKLSFGAWGYVEQPSDTDYIKAEVTQGLGGYWLWAVAYDNTNNEALILGSTYGPPYNWTRYSTPFDEDYIYTDVVGGGYGPSIFTFVVGYKKNEPERHKGLILRGDGYQGFDDITSNIPPDFPCQQSPTPFLSVSLDPFDVEKVVMTGGFGAILISTDNGENWNYTESHPNPDSDSLLSDWYYSSDWSDVIYPAPILVCCDNSGLIAMSTNDGADWDVTYYTEPYTITDYGSHSGRLTPLDIQDYACGMSFGNVAVWKQNQEEGQWEKGAIAFDNNGQSQKWWWWHGAACHTYGEYNTFPAQWFVGADGGILRCDNATFDLNNCHWERQPENDSFYKLNTVDFGLCNPIGEQWWNHGHALGSRGRNLHAQFNYEPPGNVPYPSIPDTQVAPGAPENFTMVYDAIYAGYRMHWDPPLNYDAAKVGGYWICPPEDNVDIGFIANVSPIPRTTYFLARPVGSYLIAGACPMRRDGLCGSWSNFEWCCTIDKLVDDEATGKNNARRLLYGNNTTWSFWSKDKEVYVAYSADSGKHWTYRAAQASLGSGYWPAADLGSDHNPAVCWVENVVNGSQVTARIYYRNYNGSEWNSARIVKEETFTGVGYLYPSVSVSENGKLHIVYGKVYNDEQDWQLWYGEFALGDPESVEWFLLDDQSTQPADLGKLLPTIGTDTDYQPMVVWNRPNSSTFYFACRDREGEWQYKTLSFTGTNPCIEVKGTTAYVVYENNTDIWYCVGGTGGFGKAKRISNTPATSSAPVIANNVIIWEEHADGDYEIYYSYLGANLKWTAPAKLFGYPYLPDRMPQITWAYPFAFVDWTQGDTYK
ncbi:MAG: hypothetical protein OEV79_09345, partial [candidate division WOR-3 bacterium]|nr:hypothetical protein [candidate division WOR-3 bacterium]